MHWIDYVLFGVYMVAVLSIGFYYYTRNKSTEDYYVGSRKIKPWHVGLSVVATDVGGGFSIGLAGLGFIMGLSGAWLLFTGLIGAWLVAVFVIPLIKRVDAKHNMMTYPDFLRFRFGGGVAALAALISGIGYMGFTGAQALAGAKLASETIFPEPVLGMSPLLFSLIVIAFVTIIYTVAGGLKAVIYTDTFQWIILLTGLILFAIPFTIYHMGGWQAIESQLPPEFLTMTNVKGMQIVNWFIAILPIWLIGMTLYQRLYAVKGEKEAKQAWFIAGIFEFPIMAFTGVILGMFASVMFPAADPERGLPMLVSTVLPIGVTGIVIAAYFSAIMSTADSCLMASSGNFVNDFIQRIWLKKASDKAVLRVSQVATFVIGVAAIVIASQFEMVLDAMLYAYGFMVGGLFVPTFGAYFWKRASRAGAFWSMLMGGIVTLTMQLGPKAGWFAAPLTLQGEVLEPAAYGIAVSAVVFIALSLGLPDRPETTSAPGPTSDREPTPAPSIE